MKLNLNLSYKAMGFYNDNAVTVELNGGRYYVQYEYEEPVQCAGVAEVDEALCDMADALIINALQNGVEGNIRTGYLPELGITFGCEIAGGKIRGWWTLRDGVRKSHGSITDLSLALESAGDKALPEAKDVPMPARVAKAIRLVNGCSTDLRKDIKIPTIKNRIWNFVFDRMEVLFGSRVFDDLGVSYGWQNVRSEYARVIAFVGQQTDRVCCFRKGA